ncbi:MAG: hypothetical protein JWP43_3370 [Ramlibacter sp.]|jgi:hypothetical protein|nr:hypothetical protein [Ramlibacter sp.]
MTTQKFLSLMAVATVALSAFAAVPTPSAKAEIDQLLTRLQSSGCQFERNGSWHNANEARAHIESKYQYLLKKELVGSTEDFIVGAATQSSMSGKPYQVKCGNVQLTSAQWMTEQLKQVRAPGAKK